MPDPLIFPARSARVEAGAPRFTVARVALVVTLLAAPLAFGAVQPWAWGALAVAAFLLCFLWSMAVARAGALRVVWSPLYGPGALFFLLGLVQLAGRFTLDRMGTRESLLKLATDLGIFFLTLQFFGEESSPSGPVLVGPARDGGVRVGAGNSDFMSSAALRWTLILYTFALALFAIFQFFSSDGTIYWSVPSPGWTFGPYVNHNHYAGLMEMLIPLAVASALPVLRRQASAAVLGALLLIPVASLLLSGSRGGLIALLTEVLLAGALVLAFGPRHARRPTALVGGGALVAAALLFFWMAPRQLAERLAKMGDTAHLQEVELGNRLVAARDSLGIWRDHRWLGAGLGSFESDFPRYQSFSTDLRWDHAHNDYAEALAETGVAGAAIVVLAVAGFFWLAFANLRQRLRGPAGWMQFGAAMGCFGILVHSLADFNLHMPANAAWFAFCAAVATSRLNHRGTEASRQK